jgi:hypothetical protein
MSHNIFDFDWYSSNLLKISTKIDGIQPFKLRDYQLKYLNHIKNDFNGGIVRSVVLKPRQAGFSTLVAGINSHRMLTESNYKGILLADKHGRTAEVHSIYKHFVNHVPSKIKPMMAKNNSEEILFDNPNEDERIDKPGFNSGFKSETANDANAGRSGTRKWAHLTEHAFYRFAEEIDEGIQNSIPLARGTYVVKESTAWGVSGNGEAFYNLWCAAESGQSIYKAYFVSWYEIPDYSVNVPIGFILNKDEIELLKICPEIKNENLAWRRLKLSEYSMGKESVFTPEERFCQDFPSWPEQAFLSTGRPVFDRDKLNIQIKSLRDNPVQEIKPKYTKTYLSMYQDSLKVYEPPIKEKKYIIGADIAEGIETGDFSTAFVMDTDHKQVASFHCHIDPDHFGKLLVELAIIYNGALLVPEINSMGHTTLTAIKSMDYLKVYMRSIDDEVIDEETSKMGWRTTRSSKQTMISKLVARFRDNEIKIRDVNLLKDMLGLARESDGNVELTGIDRVVAACLACVGIDQIYEAATVTNPNKKQKILYETKDLYREKLHGKSK